MYDHPASQCMEYELGSTQINRFRLQKEVRTRKQFANQNERFCLFEN